MVLDLLLVPSTIYTERYHLYPEHQQPSLHRAGIPDQHGHHDSQSPQSLGLQPVPCPSSPVLPVLCSLNLHHESMVPWHGPRLSCVAEGFSPEAPCKGQVMTYSLLLTTTSRFKIISEISTEFTRFSTAINWQTIIDFVKQFSF